jgi:tRNA (guanine-N7-)-methyltransferase
VTQPAELWRAVFGTAYPVEIEIGPGRGDVVLAFAAERPATNFFAIERAAGLADAIAAEARRRRLANVRVVAGDACCVLRHLVPPDSVSAVHVYFPDPWPKTRHRHRRLFDRPDLAEAIRRALVPGGLVHVATDLSSLHDAMCARLAAAGLVASDARGPLRPVSKFERKYAAAGTYAAAFSRPV